MSSTKTAQRRLSLLAGSSVAAASLATVAFTGAAVAPTAALAANECGVQAGTTPIVCAAGTYAGGVTYDANGNLVVTFTNPTTSNIGGSGVVLSGQGSESITFDSAATNTELQTVSLTGALLDVQTESGAITIRTEEMDADNSNPVGVTHAIRAIATGAGGISITTSGNVDAQGANPADAIGIEARSGGGNISIVNGSTVAGEAYGILAATSGTATLTLDIGGNVNADGANGIAAISTTAGTGATNINITSGTINSGAGVAIRSNSASTSGVNIQNTGGTVSGAVDFSGVTAGGVTFSNNGTTTNSGRWIATGASIFTGFNDTLTLAGAGSSSMASGSSLSFGAGNDTFSISTELQMEAGSSISFGAGNDTLTVSGLLNMGDFQNAAIDFGSGVDTFNMSGTLSIDDPEIVGLEAFNNSGVIYLGAGRNPFSSNSPVIWTETDGFAEEALVMQGTTFTGSGASRIVVDALLGAGEQAGCGTITVVDCLDLTGGATAGSTLVTVNYIGADAELGAYTTLGATVVDVTGGTSAAGDFTLDPDSPGYVADATFGGMIDRPGLFRYALRYDAANQHHNLVGVPRSEAMEYAMLSSAAQSVWHMTADTVTDRQTDLRAGAAGGSLWLHTAGEYTKRDVSTAFSIYGDNFAFDNSYKLYAGTIIGGLDLIGGDSGTFEYVLGGQIGYVSSSFDLTASPSSGRMTGATGGLYGSLWNSLAFVDAALNLNGLTLDYDAPGLGSKTNTFLNSVGLRLDTGTRLPLTDVIYAEPLASFAFARTSFEEISLSGGEIKPGDAKSARGALGLRIGGDYEGTVVNASYYVTGRAWTEFEGESDGVVQNPGTDLPFADDISGAFGEAEAGISLFNTANTLSGFLTTGVKFKDGYSAVDLSLGVRMAW